MREFILAMRAIWATWHEGKPLEFTGKFYTHTLMTPMFTPTDVDYGAPKVFLAAVGPKMTEVAGEVADGVIVKAVVAHLQPQVGGDCCEVDIAAAFTDTVDRALYLHGTRFDGRE